MHRLNVLNFKSLKLLYNISTKLHDIEIQIVHMKPLFMLDLENKISIHVLLKHEINE